MLTSSLSRALLLAAICSLGANSAPTGSDSQLQVRDPQPNPQETEGNAGSMLMPSATAGGFGQGGGEAWMSKMSSMCQASSVPQSTDAPSDTTETTETPDDTTDNNDNNNIQSSGTPSSSADAFAPTLGSRSIKEHSEMQLKAREARYGGGGPPPPGGEPKPPSSGAHSGNIAGFCSVFMSEIASQTAGGPGVGGTFAPSTAATEVVPAGPAETGSPASASSSAVASAIDERKR